MAVFFSSCRQTAAMKDPFACCLENCLRPRVLEDSTNIPLLDMDNLQAEREQALRDYKVTIEFKHLKSHSPGGVYLIPSLAELRTFYGVIFVRRGPFTNGIFKFQLKLPNVRLRSFPF